MRTELLGLLACPEDAASPLLLEVEHTAAANPDEVLAGRLRCPRCCRQFPISGGVAELLPDSLTDGAARREGETREVADKRREIATRDRQAPIYHTYFDTFANATEITAFLRHNPQDPDAIVLDAGAGTGRLALELALRCRWVVATDFSRRSLEILGAAADGRGLTVDLVCADLCALPFRDGVFHRCTSAQVLEHIPSCSARAAAVRGIHRALRAGGTLTLSVYNHSLPKRWAHLRGLGHDTAKCGYHSRGTIYYHNYSVPELRALVRGLFKIERLVGLHIPYLARLGRIGIHVERCLQPTPLSRSLGDLLLLSARKLARDAR